MGKRPVAINDGKLVRINGRHPDEWYRQYRKDGMSHDEAVAAVRQLATETETPDEGTDQMLGVGGLAPLYGSRNVLNAIDSWQPPQTLREQEDATTEATAARDRIEDPYEQVKFAWEDQGPTGADAGEFVRGIFGGRGADPSLLQGRPGQDMSIEGIALDPTIGLVEQADPESMAAMRAALGELEDTYRQEGFSDADLSRRALSEAEIDARVRQERETALRNLEARGMSGGGAELAMLMGSGQGGIQARAMEEAKLQADAGQRALDALQSSYDAAAGIHKINQDIENSNDAIRRAAHYDTVVDERSARDYNAKIPFLTADYELRRAGGMSGASSEVGRQAGTAAQVAGNAREWEIMRNDAKAAGKAADTAGTVGAAGDTIIGGVRTWYGDPGGVPQATSGVSTIGGKAKGAPQTATPKKRAPGVY